MTCDALLADVPLEDVDAFDAIAVPGGMPGAARLARCKPLADALKLRAASKRLIAAQCAAPAVVLAPLGILDGAPHACVAPAFEDQLPEGCGVPLVPPNRRQRDDMENPVPERIREAYLKMQPPREKENLHFDAARNVLTARGAGTVMRYALTLLEHVADANVAREVAFSTAMWDATPDGKELCFALHTRPGARDPRGIYDTEQMAFRNPNCSVLVPIAYGSDLAGATVLADLLRRANAEVVLASIEETLEIVGSRDLRVTADCGIDGCLTRDWDAVVCPGGQPGASRLAADARVVALLTRQRDAMRLHGALDEGGAVILAPNGLLDRRVVLVDSGEPDPPFPAGPDQAPTDPSMVPYGRLRRQFGTPADGPVRVSCNRAYARLLPPAPQDSRRARRKGELPFDPTSFCVTVDGPCVTTRGAGCYFEAACTIASYVLCHEPIDETAWTDVVLRDLNAPAHLALFV